MKYSGGCHCGEVRYEVDLKIENALACNCSICHKKGSLLAFAPAADFRLLQGESSLSDYQFGAKTIHHRFCSTCGISSFSSGSQNGVEMRAINLRCLDGIELDKIPITHFDGKQL
jgi:hypothetical protein